LKSTKPRWSITESIRRRGGRGGEGGRGKGWGRGRRKEIEGQNFVVEDALGVCFEAQGREEVQWLENVERSSRLGRRKKIEMARFRNFRT
jgi:hypothetical protein